MSWFVVNLLLFLVLATAYSFVLSALAYVFQGPPEGTGAVDKILFQAVLGLPYFYVLGSPPVALVLIGLFLTRRARPLSRLIIAPLAGVGGAGFFVLVYFSSLPVSLGQLAWSFFGLAPLFVLFGLVIRRPVRQPTL